MRNTLKKYEPKGEAINCRVPADIKKDMQKLANRDGRTLTNYCTQLFIRTIQESKIK